MEWLTIVLVAFLVEGTLSSYPRPVTRILTVQNGGTVGKWRNVQFCPDGAFASSFQLKVQRNQGILGDDTALNGVRLGCTFEEGAGYGGEITSYESPWGQWTSKQSCHYRKGKFMFIRGFVMRVASWLGPLGDDTSANNLIFICGPRTSHFSEEHKGNGMHWGSFGVSSGKCPKGSAVCGIQVRAESPQWAFGDDTAINDIKLYCCNH